MMPARPPFAALIVLFVGFRVVALLAHPPLQIGTVEKGLTAYGDFTYHFEVAQGVAGGLFPYRDYWYEYPPLIPLIGQVAYTFSGGQFTPFAILLSLILTGFEVGNLRLIRQIGARLHGPEAGEWLGWLYALCAAPFFLIFWNFEAIVTFFLLLPLWEMINGRAGRAGVAIGIGVLVKVVPLVMLAPLWRYLPFRRALIGTGWAGGIAAVGAAAILLIGAERGFGGPSLLAQFAKSSHQTVWALIDGNTGTGVFPSDLATRQDAAAALQPRQNPPVIPAWLRLVPFVGLGLIAFFWTPRTERGVIGLGGVVLILVYLWSGGWSPQWVAGLIPFLLLARPSDGAVFGLGITVLSLAEYPGLYLLFGSPEGLVPSAYPAFAALVLTRTVGLCLIGFGLWRFGRARSA